MPPSSMCWNLVGVMFICTVKHGEETRLFIHTLQGGGSCTLGADSELSDMLLDFFS